jgi:hypothetical protein
MGEAALRDGLIAPDHHYLSEGARQMSRIIDADSHFMEPLDLWEQYIEPKYRSRCLRFEREPDGNYAMLLDGKRTTGLGEFTNRELLGVAVGLVRKRRGST